MTGCLTQEDPIGLAGGLNLYGFAGGDPVNFSDPFGLRAECPPCEEDGKDWWSFRIDEQIEKGLDWLSGALTELNRRIEGIPILGGLVRSTGGVSADGQPLSDSERAVSLGEAVLDAGLLFGTGGGSAGRLTTAQAADLATYLGYTSRVRGVPFKSMGQAVFTNGRNFITADVTGHLGGVWKMFDLRGRRVGTFDALLNLIGR